MKRAISNRVSRRAPLLGALVGLAALAGCKTTDKCNQGTVLATVEFDTATKAANMLDVQVSIAGAAPKSSSLSHRPGDAQGSVEIDFPGGYPVGKRVDVTIVARTGSTVLGMQTGTITSLPSGCATLSIRFGGGGDGGAGAGGGGRGGTGGSTGGMSGTGGSNPDGMAGQSGTDGGTDGPTTGCTSGTKRACAADGYQGNCATGTETCAGGTWSACSISPMPKDSCATKGDDATCNGTPNEGCDCLDADPPRSCSMAGALGNCARGTQSCSGGKWGACSIQPATKDDCTVKGDDANCNGMPNDGCPCVNGDTQACGPAAVGICKPGTATCANSVWGACQGAVNKAARDCTSAMDNDCDGSPDNTIDVICKCGSGTTQACGAHPGNDGYGPCKAGTQSCMVASDKATSTWGPCGGAVGPAGADTCVKGNDDNCNGTPNEGCACVSTDPPRSCAAGGALGNCAQGTQACVSGQWAACSIQPASMDNCSVKGDDANCNGMANEGCPCVTGDTQTCGPAAVGICKPGTATCTAGVWGPCVGAVNKSTRDCTSPNDNDCDGSPDNKIDTVCACASGATQACGAHPGKDGNGPCKAGSQACVVAPDKTSSAWGTCNGSVGPGPSDTCVQGNDNNCSGTANDGCLCINNVTTRNCGYCNDGSQTCVDGTVGSYTACAGATGQPFTALALLNGWMNSQYTSAAPAAALDCKGIVQLKGAMQTAGTNMQPFILPPGLRPSSGTLWIPADGYAATKVRLEILTDGTVYVGWRGAQTDATKFTSLEGVSFPVSNAGYAALTLQNGWMAYSTSTRAPAVANINGIVRFEGAIASGTTTPAFTLAASLAPSGVAYVTADEVNAAEGRFYFNTAGVANPESAVMFSDAQMFTSLESVWYPLTATGYTALALQNSWVPYGLGTRAPAVSVSGGIVRFQGAMKTSGTSGTAFTLPGGFLPAADVYTPVNTFGGTKGRLHISPSGTVIVEPENTTGGDFSKPASFTSLEGVSFAQ